MPQQTDYFWTDAVQAAERLTGTFGMYEEDVVRFDRIGAWTGVPRADVTLFPDMTAKKLNLNDKGFKKFRVLPPMGWFNYEQRPQAMLLERRPVRSRLHGLSDNNVSIGYVMNLSIQWRDYRLEQVFSDPGFKASIKGGYPPLDKVLISIRDGTTIAVGRSYAVHRDDIGLRWLYRHGNRVGIFSDADSLVLIKKYAFLREELTESAEITVKKIQEF